MGWWKRLTGQVIKEGPRIPGAYSGFHQWRIKRGISRSSFISLYFKTLFHYGPSRGGGGTFYIEFTLDDARRSLNSLTELIRLMEDNAQ
jgi:hypothetical protein